MAGGTHQTNTCGNALAVGRTAGGCGLRNRKVKTASLVGKCQFRQLENGRFLFIYPEHVVLISRSLLGEGKGKFLIICIRKGGILRYRIDNLPSVKPWVRIGRGIAAVEVLGRGIAVLIAAVVVCRNHMVACGGYRLGGFKDNVRVLGGIRTPFGACIGIK